MGRLGGAATTKLGRGARGKGPTEGGHVPGTTDRGEKSNIGACGAPSHPFDLKFGGSTGRGRFGPWAKRNGAGGRGSVEGTRTLGPKGSTPQKMGLFYVISYGHKKFT